jgi:hypothetical protein
MSDPPGNSRRSQAARDRVTGLLLGIGALLAVHFLLRSTYWDYSEGVYALTAHLMLHGGDLYGHIVGAQPPGVFLTGTLLLAIHDSLEWLRLGVGSLQLLAGLFAGEIVWRLSGNRLAAVLTPAAVLLTPWAVHEHGALTPEMVALPFLLGAVLVSVDARRAPLLGVLCGVVPLIKVPLLIPAIVLLALSSSPRRAAGWAIATLACGVLATTLLGGTNAWRDAVYAQTQSGYHGLGVLKGVWAQAGWNMLGLLVPAAVAVRGRGALREPKLARASFGLAAAMLLTFATNLKDGTALNITVPVEAALVPLAACGVVLALRARGAVAVLVVAALAFVAAQSASLITSPHHPQPFLRAGSRPAWGVSLTAPELRRAVAEARACPPGAAFGGPPLIALIADRRPPAGQVDEFIITHARVLHRVREEVVAVRDVCP